VDNVKTLVIEQLDKASGLIYAAVFILLRFFVFFVVIIVLSIGDRLAELF
jgi:hypothetical protein